MRSLLTAIAGPVMEMQFACLPCGGHLRLSEESLSRILVNLVRNAADAMPTGGHIRITTQRGNGASFLWTVDEETEEEQATDYLWDDLPHTRTAGSGTVLLTVEDNGPGIPTEFLERVFDAGFTTRQRGQVMAGVAASRAGAEHCARAGAGSGGNGARSNFAGEWSTF